MMKRTAVGRALVDAKQASRNIRWMDGASRISHRTPSCQSVVRRQFNSSIQRLGRNSSNGIRRITTSGSHCTIRSTKQHHQHHSTVPYPSVLINNSRSNTAAAAKTVEVMTAERQLVAAVTTAASAISRPSNAALKMLFTASAIPMVGFGFMDNFVMIQAGQYIDTTLGVSLGLATMTAAAAGQVVSDVSGVVFGGALERCLLRLGLVQIPKLSTAQRQLSICRNVSMAGAVIGVIIGCALGATTLLFVDLEARDRIQRTITLKEIIHEMVNTNSSANIGSLQCSHCTMYVNDTTGNNQYNFEDATSQQQQSLSTTTKLERLQDVVTTNASVQQCIEQNQIISGDNDVVMYAPIISNADTDKEVLGVIAFHRDPERNSHNSSIFHGGDIATANVIARHVAIFMKKLVD